MNAAIVIVAIIAFIVLIGIGQGWFKKLAEARLRKAEATGNEKAAAHARREVEALAAAAEKLNERNVKAAAEREAKRTAGEIEVRWPSRSLTWKPATRSLDIRHGYMFKNRVRLPLQRIAAVEYHAIGRLRVSDVGGRVYKFDSPVKAAELKAIADAIVEAQDQLLVA